MSYRIRGMEPFVLEGTSLNHGWRISIGERKEHEIPVFTIKEHKGYVCVTQNEMIHRIRYRGHTFLEVYGVV